MRNILFVLIGCLFTFALNASEDCVECVQQSFSSSSKVIAKQDLRYFKRHLTIALNSKQFPPFKSFDADGTPYGFEIDLMEAIFKYMPQRYSYSYISSFEDIAYVYTTDENGDVYLSGEGSILFRQMFPFLYERRRDSNGNLIEAKYVVDMILGTAGIRKSREQKFNMRFSDSYFKPKKHFWGKSLETFPDDLSNMRIGAEPGTLWKAFLEYLNVELCKKNLKPIRIISYNSIGEKSAVELMMIEIVNKKLDFTLFDDRSLIELKVKLQNTYPDIKNYDLVGPELISIDKKKIFGHGVGVGFRKNDNSLRNAFNSALQRVRSSGEYDIIHSKYFGE